MDLKWEIKLNDDTVVKELDGNSFNLKWLCKGIVKELKLTDGNNNYILDLNSGNFNINGVNYSNEESSNKGIDNYKLIFFKRNTIISNISDLRNCIKKVQYNFGYVYEDKEIIYGVSDNFSGWFKR